MSGRGDEEYPGLCRRCGLSPRAAIEGVLCDPPYAGIHDFAPLTPPTDPGAGQ